MRGYVWDFFVTDLPLSTTQIPPRMKIDPRRTPLSTVVAQEPFFLNWVFVFSAIMRDIFGSTHPIDFIRSLNDSPDLGGCFRNLFHGHPMRRKVFTRLVFLVQTPRGGAAPAAPTGAAFFCRTLRPQRPQMFFFSVLVVSDSTGAFTDDPDSLSPTV